MTLSLDALRELYRHMEWADASVWRVARAHPPAAQDGRLRRLLLHIHTVQRAFLLVWTGGTLAFPKLDDFPDLASIHAWGRPTYADSARFLASADADALQQPVVMPWAARLTADLGREPHAPTLGETIFQVASHSTYHRGQVNARLREIGGEPPLVDYIAWVWFGKPAPDWQEV